jgi:hypothetical protein
MACGSRHCPLSVSKQEKENGCQLLRITKPLSPSPPPHHTHLSFNHDRFYLSTYRPTGTNLHLYPTSNSTCTSSSTSTSSSNTNKSITTLLNEMSDDAPAFEPQSLAPVSSADIDNSQSAPTANGSSLKDTMVDSKVCRVILNPFSFLRRLTSLQTQNLTIHLP